MLFIVDGFNRYRVSIIDMYPHVRERFMDANLPLPYGEKFYPDEKQINLVNSMIKEIKEFRKNDVRIECCAEPKLTEAIQCGCISKYDLDLFGLEYDDVDQIGYQRKNCMCCSGKKELLSSKKQCKNKCLYCYWK